MFFVSLLSSFPFSTGFDQFDYAKDLYMAFVFITTFQALISQSGPRLRFRATCPFVCLPHAASRSDKSSGIVELKLTNQNKRHYYYCFASIRPQLAEK